MLNRIRFVFLVPLIALTLSGCVAMGPDGLQANKTIQSYDQNSWQSNKALLRAAEESGNYELMVSTARNVVTRSPGNQEARIYYAKALTKSGDAEQTLRILTPVEASRYPSAHIEKARAMVSLGDTAGALKELSDFDLAFASESARQTDAQTRAQLQRESLKLKAVTASLTSDFSTARSLYEKLMQEKDEPDVRFNYARTLLFTDKPKEALNLLQPLIGVMPQAKFAAAVAMIELGQTKEARNLLNNDIDDAGFDKLLKLHKAR